MPTSPLLQTECLSDDTLKRYLAGYLPEDSATQVEQHLSQCTVCEDLMREIDSNGSSDDLLRPLQTNSLSPKSLSPKSLSPKSLESVPATTQRPWLPWMTGREVGPYELIEPLGHGGMGLVYLARHRKLDRLVAMKLLPAHHQTAEARVRFEREILAAGRLQHPAIVSATDAGQFGDMDYLVMEYVRGMDLGRLSKSIPTLSVEETCEIGRQIALGLSYAHAQGLVHRDIKPSNVILDDAGAVKILDFGLVLFDRWDGVSSELTTVGQFLGTLDYMAPEQAERCGAVDYRADLYALGATMFKLMCGRAPLAAAPNQSPIDKLRLLASHRPPSLKTLRPDAPGALVKLVDSLLSTSPQERPASAAHVAEDLLPWAKSGCLIELMAKARSLEGIAVLQDAVPSNGNKQSHPIANSPVPVSQTSDRNGGGSRRWLWIAAAMVPLAFLAGYIIKLDTPDGQLIVESEIAGAQIRIVKAGAEAKNLKVETGNNVTRLLAGKYEVTLDSPSDGVSIDRDSFVIAKGETVIARVRRETPSSAVQNGPPSRESNSTVASTGPVFEGKTLAESLEVARREREPKGWLTAMNAVTALTGLEQKKELFEEAFLLCMDRKMFSPIAHWSQDNVFATRMLQELEKSDPPRRKLLLNLTGELIPDERMDPIWNWLEGISKNDPKEADLLTRSVLGLEDGAFNPNRPIDISSIAYLTVHFPRLASLFDSYLISNFSKKLEGGFANNQLKFDKRGSLFAYVQRLAMVSLEKTDSGFADRVASLSVVLRTPYEKMGSDQKEMVLRQVVNLLSQAWENRTTPYSSEMTNLSVGPNSLKWQSKRNANSVSRLLGVLSSFMSNIKKEQRPPVILFALAELEGIVRPEAMTAWSELPKELQGTIPSEFTFNGYDFRLEEKYLNQLPSTLTPERKEQIDQLSVAYILHRYASYLLWGSDPRNNPSPDEIGMQLAAFRKQDANHDWLLTEDEWPLDFKARFGPNTKSIGIQAFVDATMPTPVTATVTNEMREWAVIKMKKMDKNNDGYLSPDEATGLDFIKTDTDKDGRISLDEYIVSKSVQ